MSVLILTLPGDYHAHAVRWAIEQLGEECRLLYPLDLCADGQWSYYPEQGLLQIDNMGERQSLTSADFQSLWSRRPSGIYPQERLSDTAERAVAEEEFGHFAIGVMKRLEFGKFVVNPSDKTAMASHKTYQLATALHLGLTGPKTLISNSPSEILDFFAACGNEVVYKPLKSALWSLPNGLRSIVPTTLITDRDMLLNVDLAAAPGIFQEKIEKRAEIRATFMGKSVFAWEKRFENRDYAEIDIDWRMMYNNCVHGHHTLPDDLVEKCFALLAEFGLVFGCFDFAMDTEGKYHFLEVNPQGQFLWGDCLGLGINQLEAFAEFLISRDPNFRYSGKNRFNIAQYDSLGSFDSDLALEEKSHYGNVKDFFYKRVAVVA